MKISIIVPFYNETETAHYVMSELIETNPHAEIIAVDDGSKDDTAAILASFGNRIRLIRFAQNRGQSAAMYAGLKTATGDFLALIDGDGQNDPSEIIRLYEELKRSGRDFVCGYRAARKDTFSKRLASRIANRIRRIFLRDGVRDTGCSLKIMHRACVDHLVPFNGMHRYIPAILLQAGFTFSELPVNHRARYAGNSKYNNWSRAIRGIYDLIGVSWLLRRKVRFDGEETQAEQKAHAV